MAITIHFDGICTFISRGTAVLPEGVQQRVVLPNCSGGIAGDMRIDPHFAHLKIGNRDWERLEGVRVWITPVPPGGLQNQEALTSLPNLTQLVEPIEPLGAPFSEIVESGNPAWVSAWFDIFGGALQVQDASSAMLAILTIDPGDGFTLHRQRFGSEHEEEPVELAPDETIHVANLSPAELRDLLLPPGPPSPIQHFLLHYLTATRYPPAAQLPQTQPIIFTKDVAGSPGCSNSTYP